MTFSMGPIVCYQRLAVVIHCLGSSQKLKLVRTVIALLRSTCSFLPPPTIVRSLAVIGLILRVLVGIGHGVPTLMANFSPAISAACGREYTVVGVGIGVVFGRAHK